MGVGVGVMVGVSVRVGDLALTIVVGFGPLSIPVDSQKLDIIA